MASNTTSEIFQFILELNKLKQVFRTTITQPDRRESTAEHSWSASMIVVTGMARLKQEFGDFDELKTLKLILIHDIVEIYAGDVVAFDAAARKDKEKIEHEALDKLAEIYPEFGKELKLLWHEFEKRETIEAKIAKAADAICPIFMRLYSKQAYHSLNVGVTKMDEHKFKYFQFSQLFSELYISLKNQLVAEGLLDPV